MKHAVPLVMIYSIHVMIYYCYIFRLQELKQDFARKAEEVARLTQENVDAELRMQEISTSHE